MFPALTEDCLDRWLANYDQFRDDFLRFCYFLSKACGYYPQVDFSKLHAAHDEWRAITEIWENSYVMPDSSGLSHIKIMGLLLFSLSKVEWVAQLEEFDPTGSHDEGDYSGTSAEWEESRKDLNSGRGTFLALQFVFAILNGFEDARDDKREPFRFRLTHDLEYDFLAYLLSERRDDVAIFLILKALYARH